MIELLLEGTDGVHVWDVMCARCSWSDDIEADSEQTCIDRLFDSGWDYIPRKSRYTHWGYICPACTDQRDRGRQNTERGSNLAHV